MKKLYNDDVNISVLTAQVEFLQVLLKDGDYFCFDDIIVKIIIKFPYNARFDWLKQRTLSENNVQVNDIRDFKIRGRGRLEGRDRQREPGSRTQRLWREN